MVLHYLYIIQVFMENQLTKAKDILIKYNQEHLLQFYNELSNIEKHNLLDQILATDFEQILNLYKQSKLITHNKSNEIEPLPYIDKSKISNSDIRFYSAIGETAIKNGEIAVITLAGGQGSRLGFRGPKGAFELETEPKISLFEVLCNYLKVASSKYNISIPWYIMTSTDNNEATVSFFESKNFFGYQKELVTFFSQDNLPLIDINGKLVLEETYKIKVASNGNGNLFNSLKKHNLINNMITKNVKWVFVGGIDNVLLNPIDPFFIGLTIHSGNLISSKTLFKEDPKDIEWIFARKNGKPSIVECENFADEIAEIKDENGNYLYRDRNMLAHLFNIYALKHMADVKLPYHRAFRKSPFVNDEGMKQVPETANIYKFEQFIFDSFSFFDNITLLRVIASEEFAPIKSFNGPYNPEIAKELYEKNVLHI